MRICPFPLSPSKDELRREIKGLHQQLKRHEDNIYGHKQDLQEASRRIEELQKDLSDSKRGHEDDTRKHQNIVSTYQNELEELRKQFAETAAAQSSNKEIADSHKASDDSILDIWRRLAYNINNVTMSLLTHCPSKEDLSIHYKSYPSLLLQCIGQQYHLFEDEMTRPALVEHYIWLSIDLQIFGNSPKPEQLTTWGGIAGTHFVFACHNLIRKYSSDSVLSTKEGPEFFNWRSQGAAMIERLVGHQDQELTTFVTSQHRDLSLLLLPSKDSKARALYEELLNIYQDALELHAIFMKSKAFFFIDWIRQKSPYDPNLMEAGLCLKVLDAKSLVVFNISPSLHKIGTANGRDFDQSILLVKSKVICN
ncbi:hypothetical protein LX36DRAFT_734952 [Colletotrichum falcatum]|nr:hypothetical protein LX36DRAFT_734952 [Colletotrichum falcatum]